MQIHYRLPLRTVVFAAFALIQSSVVFAQPVSGPEKQEVVVLDRYVVTGSHLNGPADSASLTVIDATDIQKSGVDTNVLEVLRKQMPAFSGSGNLGTSNASLSATGTYGGAKLSLHNLPTLVLLNGRRVATNGANARGGSSFVDVNQFPLAAIDHIEVLSDGASAVYGSDAIGGVVNIILKPNFNGSEIGGRYAFSTRDGDYSEESGHFTVGAGNDRIGVVVTGNYSKSSPLYQNARPFSSVATSTGYSGVIGGNSLSSTLDSPSAQVPVGPSATAGSIASLLNNGTYVAGVTPLNLAGNVTLLARQEQRSAYAAFTGKLVGDKLEAFGDLLYSKNTSFSQLGAQSTTFNGSGSNPQPVPAGSPYTPFTVNTTTSSLAPSFRYVPAPRRYDNVAELARLTAGLRGEISSQWNWESAYTYSDDRLTNRIKNVLFKPNLDLAVLGGYDQNGNPLAGGRYSRVYADYSAPAVPAGLSSAQTATYLANQRTVANTVLQPALDPFARSAGIDPASLANVLGVSRADFESKLGSCDAVVRGSAFSLPAGEVTVAAGGDYREETLIGTPDQNSQNTGLVNQRWSGGTFFDALNRSRHVTAGFGEARLPVTSAKWDIVGVHALDFTAAYRVEDYSDAGRSSVPKYAASWQPLDEQVTLRYSYSKAFAAPRLFDLFGPQALGYSSDLKSTFGLTGTSSWQATMQSGSNPALKPTTSRTHSAGVVVAPKALKGLKISIDYSDVDLQQMVGTVGALNILSSVDKLGPASPYLNQVTIDGSRIATTGQISSFLKSAGSAVDANRIYVSDTTVNVSAAKLKTLDVAAEYAFPATGIGEFELGTTGTYFLHDRIQVLPTESYYEYAGLTTTPSSGAEGTMPGYRFYSTLAWRYSAWDVLLGNTYVSSVDDIGSGGSTFANSTTLKRIRIPSYTAWDVGVGYALKLGKTAKDGNVIKLRVGINNAMDKMPPAAPQAFPTTSAAGADTATYSPIGRLYYVSADFKF
jgi:iron complex outermembrane receptor protein